MPHTTRCRKSPLYTFLTVQLLLNATFTNSAVIRRERRELEINSNVTGITTLNNEVDSISVTTEKYVESSLFGTGSSRDAITGPTVTDVTTNNVGDGKKEITTLTDFTVDQNTVSFVANGQESKSEDEYSNEEDNDSRTAPNVVEKATIGSLSAASETAIINETSTIGGTTVKTTDQTYEHTSTIESVTLQSTDITSAFALETRSESAFREEASTLNESVIMSTENTEETRTITENVPSASMSPMSVDSTTIAQVSTSVNPIEKERAETTAEGIAMSTLKTDESTTIVQTHNESTEVPMGQLFGDTMIPSVTNPEDHTTDNLTTVETTTIANLSQTTSSERSFLTSSSPSFAAQQHLTDNVNSLTSTLKTDDTTVIATSTETTFDEIQTTFQASPLLQDPPPLQDIKNSSIASAEKRGKFIDDNYSSINELRLPNTSDVWALAGMKPVGKVKSSEIQNSVETSDEKAVNNSMVTKNLLDWSRVMLNTDSVEPETTVKTTEIVETTTTDVPTVKTITEVRMPQENEVEMLTTKIQTETTTEVLNLTDRTEIQQSTGLTEIYDTKTPAKFETTTSLGDNNEANTHERYTNDSSIQQADDILSTTKSTLILLKGRDDTFIEDNQVDGVSVEAEPHSPLFTTTTTTTPIHDLTTMESETANSPVNVETTKEANTGTILTSTLSLLDFTTSMPFLTSTTMTTTTTGIRPTSAMATTATPSNAFNMDVRTNEPPNMESTFTSSPSAAAAATTAEPETTTTTTTTTPAVTVMATTTESYTTEAHTPAIISNDTMTQKSNNYNNYEVVSKTTTKSADSSSIEAFEASTRVAPNWVASTAETSATDTDRLDDFDVTTTVSNLESSNAFEVVTPQTSTTVASIFTFGLTTLPSFTTSTTTISSSSSISSTSTGDLYHIDTIQKISDTGETSIESNVIDPLQVGEVSTTTTTTTTTTPLPTTTTTENSQENMRVQSTGEGGLDMDSSSTTTSTASYDDSTTTLQSISTKKEDVYSIVPTIDYGFHVPKLVIDDTTTTTTTTSGDLAPGGGQPLDPPDAQETDVNVIIAISVSVVGIVALILLVAFLYVMRKRQKQMSYGQRCRPVSLDAYSLDNVSVYNSVRRKGAALRASKRSYGNVAFDDPSLRHNVLGTHELAKYIEKKSSIWEEFKDVPQIIARADEVPAGCEDKNRYANVIPLPETRVILQQQNSDEKSEYINANYVRGPKDTTNYYIACQAPLETTVTDFWRMIWEQNSRVIIMATDLIENGIDKCAEYLPPSVTLDNHTVFGDFQVTLKNREVKEKYAISTLMLRNTATDENREITHYWYQWPEAGVPNDEAAIIAMLLEARSSLKLSTIEQSDTIKNETIITEDNLSAKSEINGNVATEKPKSPPKDQGPLTIHCSPGTGRTGTILACDIAMRCLEEPKRNVDIPQIVYSVRRGRASAVQTKEQYEFIYKVTHMYATKISNLNNDN